MKRILSKATKEGEVRNIKKDEKANPTYETTGKWAKFNKGAALEGSAGNLLGVGVSGVN